MSTRRITSKLGLPKAEPYIRSHGATRESMASEVWKKRLLESDGSATTLSEAFTGFWARVLRNRYADDYAASGAPVLPALCSSARRRTSSQAPPRSGQKLGSLSRYKVLMPSASDTVRKASRFEENGHDH